MVVQTKTADGANQFTDQLTMPPENIMDVSITLSSDFVGEVQLQRRRPGQDWKAVDTFTASIEMTAQGVAGVKYRLGIPADTDADTNYSAGSADLELRTN
jgi:hypothetical protein